MLQIAIRKRFFGSSLAILICLATVSGGPLQEIRGADAIDEIASQWLQIADAILAKDVDPPVRQEMLKTAIQAIYKLAQQDAPPGLARKISQLDSDDELQAFLRETLVTVMAENGLESSVVREVGIGGLLAKVSGGQSLIPLSDFHVMQQLRDNRYVGIGIQLAMAKGYPVMQKVFPRGPAWHAGGRDGDQMVSIDGIDAKEMPLTKVVALLRGQEGKPTTIVVRGSGAKQTRTLNMVRGVVPFDTILGTHKDDDQYWQYTIADDPRIAYLKIESFRGSTPSELRRIAAQLHADGCRSIVLDLRGTQPGEMRYVTMVANALLGKGVIGHVLGVHGRQQFDSTADQLFPAWPMIVLVDRTTTGQAEWIAAALKDNRRATLMGTPTAGEGAILELVELPTGIGGVHLTTGILFRRDGKPITGKPITVVRQTIPEHATSIVRVKRDAERRIVLSPRTPRRKGIPPDRKVDAKRHIGDAVKMLQEKLSATTTATQQPAGATAGAFEG